MNRTPHVSASLKDIPRRSAAALVQSVRIPDRLVGIKEKSTPSFTITRERGFLPREDPYTTLPPAFSRVETLLNRMTIKQHDGSPGLLATGQFGCAVSSELEKLGLEKEMEKIIDSDDQMTISALFRDYSFLTSAYLLEPVDVSFRETGTYSTGRSVLPRVLAQPMAALARKLGQFPFMEYASSYALQNWARKNTTKGIVYDNLRLIRAFEDHEGSEKGFILVHVDMVSHSGRLVSAAEDALSAAAAMDRPAFNDALSRLYESYRMINKSMETMWKHSKPADYLKFRSFIFGTAPKEDNPMFPDGVIYEGVGDEKPMYFRGESGANDSMIPLGDNLLESLWFCFFSLFLVTGKFSHNELTEVLRDFRQYRPPNQRAYIASVEARATLAKLKEFAFADPESLALYILNVDQIREFRDRHWHFTKEYIIRRSSYGVATGGSPILRYLPQNLRTVLAVLDEACTALPSANTLLSQGLNMILVEQVEACRERSVLQKRVVEREMEVWKIVEEQKSTEVMARGVRLSAKDAGHVPPGDIDMGEAKRLQRGSVGSDRGG